MTSENTVSKYSALEADEKDRILRIVNLQWRVRPVRARTNPKISSKAAREGNDASAIR
jgi:hypothetical protein